MLKGYYYHEIIRRTIVAFGTLFNNIYIKHEEQSGEDLSLIKVPIAYGPVQKFLARIEERPDLRKRVAITLPRISFEINSIKYDSSRKVPTIQSFTSKNSSGEIIKGFMPSPYDIGLELNIITKYNDDMLQIIEQILPYFQPHFTLTVDLVSSIGEKRDIPIILEGIQMNDNYEGDYTTRRNLIYTLNFTAKTYLFGPIQNSPEGLIKKVQVDYYTSTDRKTSTRELRYIATPRAIKDYNEDNSLVLMQDIDEKTVSFDVSDGSILTEKSYITIGDEEMYIRSINDNTILVDRGRDKSIASIHSSGDYINILDELDNEMIELGDDFGFNEERFDFGDGKVYSPSKGIDVSL